MKVILLQISSFYLLYFFNLFQDSHKPLKAIYKLSSTIIPKKHKSHLTPSAYNGKMCFESTYFPLHHSLKNILNVSFVLPLKRGKL